MMLITALRFPLFWTCVVVLFSLGSGIPVQEHQDTPAELFDRATSTLAIVGVKSGIDASGKVPLRLEIRQLRKNNAQWNLYLLAMNQMQSMDQSQLTSYYQISGIHGRPYVPWDNVQSGNGVNSGYCTHSSILFPVWHRPYLALLEQTLQSIAVGIANTFTTGKAEYVAAAATLRLPYWDWVATPPSGQHVLPPTIGGSAYIAISLPNGTVTINNPLFQYRFHPLNRNDMVYSPFTEYPTTLRYPTSQAANAQSQNSWVSTQLDQSQSTYSKRFMNLLQAYPLYGNFSNEAWIPNSPGTYDSLESLHDQIHGLVGNGGHMSYLDYSAFDPIFYLHHTNIDRLFAIWQAIYPNSYIQPSTATSGTATINSGDYLDQNSNLTPFHKDANGNFWTPALVRDTQTFGYSYPEIQGNDIPGVKRAVNALYSTSSGVSLSRRSGTKDNRDDTSSSDLPATTSTQLSAQPSARPTGVAALIAGGLSEMPGSANSSLTTLPKGTYQEWITNIRVLKTALESTFFIHVFLGDFNPNPNLWTSDSNLVGTHTVTTLLVANPALSQKTVVTGTIPLTGKIQMDADQGKVNMGDTTAVEAYLTKNLHWRITKMDNTPVHPSQVSQLKISVVSSIVQVAQSESDFPVWGEFTVHEAVTNNRAGGLRIGEAT